MELNTQTPVPEWNDQPVTIMAEDPVFLTDEGWKFFRPLVDAARLRVKAADEKKARDEAALIRKSWPTAKPSAKGAEFVVRRQGSGDPAKTGQILTVRYTGRLLDGRPFASSAEEGRPVPGSVATPFEYEAGRARINPGVDDALLEMRPGEKRTVIVQGAAGYGTGGYTSREKPGEKRFVISPNTTLVYEIEIIAIRQ